jgi:hypothetical protein
LEKYPDNPRPYVSIVANFDAIDIYTLPLLNDDIDRAMLPVWMVEVPAAMAHAPLRTAPYISTPHFVEALSTA